jgi:DNA-binding CsgD family transcriptional regulator
MKSSYSRLQDAEILYNRMLDMSKNYFVQDEIAEKESFIKEAAFLLKGVKGTDAVIGIFNHNNYSPELEVGEKEFWGDLPEVPQEERMVQIMSLLDKNYISFFTDSVDWFQETLAAIPFEQRVNVSIFHCGIRYVRLDDSPICLFSKGMPIHYDAQRNFTFTFNYVQNVHHLFKKEFPHYWIRIAYGDKKEFVHTLHSADKRNSSKDLLSQREKEILKLIAADLDTKQIAEKLFISATTVGHHRSNMIERIGARDTTALLQLAKMAEII